MTDFCETPFFTVIICAYNRQKLLNRALLSLFNQTESSFEVVIVDDGSTDETFYEVRRIIDKRFESFPDLNIFYNNFDSNNAFSRKIGNHFDIFYVYQNHNGVAGARNRGISLARGNFVTFLDSDDEYKPNHLHSRKEILTNHPEIDLLHGGFEILGSPFVPDKNDPTTQIHLSKCVVGGTFFIKTAIARQLGGFDHLDFAEDSAFYDKAVCNGLNISKTDLMTYIYHRDTSDSICNAISKEKLFVQ